MIFCARINEKGCNKGKSWRHFVKKNFSILNYFSKYIEKLKIKINQK